MLTRALEDMHIHSLEHGHGGDLDAASPRARRSHAPRVGGRGTAGVPLDPLVQRGAVDLERTAALHERGHLATQGRGRTSPEAVGEGMEEAVPVARLAGHAGPLEHGRGRRGATHGVQWPGARVGVVVPVLGVVRAIRGRVRSVAFIASEGNTRVCSRGQHRLALGPTHGGREEVGHQAVASRERGGEHARLLRGRRRGVIGGRGR
mmetsp:Transcript_18912/g.59979  ORF Transcript_18912/g.59979 Transcript_18912/m.59979 type:complete len:206 (-) Transcript_18912:439-1056(-)